MRDLRSFLVCFYRHHYYNDNTKKPFSHQIWKLGLAADDTLSKQLKSIENECSKMTIAINETQVAFGNQEAGRQLIARLYQAIRDLLDAESMIFIAKKNIRNYVQKVRY